MSISTKKFFDTNLKFVYSDNNTLSVIFSDNDLLMGVVGEFNKNLKELEKITEANLFSRGNSILIKSTLEKNEKVKNAIQFLATQYINNGNIENKGSYDTEMNIDLDLPQSDLWIVEGDFDFTNSDGVTLQWKNNQTYDIQAYLVEYRETGNLTWNDFGSFTSPGQFWFSPTKDATFEIRSRSVDYAGNIEIKDKSDIDSVIYKAKPIQFKKKFL